MKKFSKLVVALVAVAGIAFTAGCKSDCEKAYDNAVAKADEKTKKDAQSEEGKKTFMDMCGKLPAEAQKCMAGAADEKAMMECAAKAAAAATEEKKDEKAEEKK